MAVTLTPAIFDMTIKYRNGAHMPLSSRNKKLVFIMDTSKLQIYLKFKYRIMNNIWKLSLSTAVAFGPHSIILVTTPYVRGTSFPHLSHSTYVSVTIVFREHRYTIGVGIFDDVNWKKRLPLSRLLVCFILPYRCNNILINIYPNAWYFAIGG